MDFSKLLLYVPGIVIFLVGSGQVRDWLRIRRSGFSALADIISCNHVVKKDKKDRDLFDYYNVVVEYVNPKTQHTERQAIKSPTEYAISQQVRVLKESDSASAVIVENKDEFPLHPFVMLVIGALLIVLALEQNRGNQIPAMICLSLILSLAGINLILDYIFKKKRNLQPIQSEVVSVYTRQISRSTKIIKGDKFTYYPVVRYQLDGRENMRRCNINSGSEKSFKPGDHLTLYYDPVDHVIQESHAKILYLIVGIALTAVGVLAGASILSVVIPH